MNFETFQILYYGIFLFMAVYIMFIGFKYGKKVWGVEDDSNSKSTWTLRSGRNKREKSTLGQLNRTSQEDTVLGRWLKVIRSEDFLNAYVFLLVLMVAWSMILYLYIWTSL